MANKMMVVVIFLSLLLLSDVSCTNPMEELNKMQKRADKKVVEICKVVPVKKTCESAYYMAGGDDRDVTPEKVLMKQIEASRMVATWVAGQLATCKKSLRQMVARMDEAEEGARLHNDLMVKHELGMAMGHVAKCEEAVNGDLLHTQAHDDVANNMRYASKVLQEMLDNCITLADNTYAFAR